jgi:hypothetical protein
MFFPKCTASAARHSEDANPRSNRRRVIYNVGRFIHFQLSAEQARLANEVRAAVTAPGRTDDDSPGKPLREQHTQRRGGVPDKRLVAVQGAWEVSFFEPDWGTVSCHLPKSKQIQLVRRNFIKTNTMSFDQ